MVVGPRTFETALSLIAMTAGIVLGVPCFFSDGFSCYFNALIEYYHQIKIFPKTGKRGRPREPVKEPHLELVYGQIIKKKKNGKLVEITYRIMCGAERLAQLGFKIGTGFLERLNLTIRQSLAPLKRKTLGYSKARENLKKQGHPSFCSLHFSEKEQTLNNFLSPLKRLIFRHSTCHEKN